MCSPPPPPPLGDCTTPGFNVSVWCGAGALSTFLTGLAANNQLLPSDGFLQSTPDFKCQQARPVFGTTLNSAPPPSL